MTLSWGEKPVPIPAKRTSKISSRVDELLSKKVEEHLAKSKRMEEHIAEPDKVEEEPSKTAHTGKRI